MKFDPLKLAEQLETAAKLLRKYGPDAERLAHDWASPLRSGGTRGGKNSISDPTGSSAVDPDPTWEYQTTLDSEATHVFDHLVQLVKPVVKLGKAAHSHVPELKRSTPAGAGECPACGRWVSGAASDRLRAGLCDADRKAWDRAGRPERAPWIHLRRYTLDPTYAEQFDSRLDELSWDRTKRDGDRGQAA